MVLEVEYLDEALDEAEAAARWYAERSPIAALGFSDEIDTAISAMCKKVLLNVDVNFRLIPLVRLICVYLRSCGVSWRAWRP